MLNKKDDDAFYHHDLFQELLDAPLTRSQVLLPKVCKNCMEEYNAIINKTNHDIKAWLVNTGKKPK